jgi:hypothetical protein
MFFKNVIHHSRVTFFRGMSTVHAIFITVMSVYLVFFSNLFSDQLDGPVTFRSSNLSNFILGVSDVPIESHSTMVSMLTYTVLFFAGIYSSFSPFVSFFCQVSVGYFVTDLAMIFWAYPSLGGMEYVSESVVTSKTFFSLLFISFLSTPSAHKCMMFWA